MKKNDNRGSTIIMVIIVVVGVGVMAAISLWLSIRNFQMKKTDTEVKESFYSAEAVLEQIKAGLQKDVEDAYVTALTVDFENMAGKSQDDREEYFVRNFKSIIEREINPTGGTDSRYSTEKLSSYVDESLIDKNKLPYTVITAMSGSIENAIGLIENKKNSLVIKGLKIRYVDENEVVSEISTDITIKIPKAGTIETVPIPDVLEYSLIGNEGVVINGTNNIGGSLYAGSPYSKNNSRTGSKEALLVKNGSNFSMSDNYLISNGTTTVKPGANLALGENVKYWTENIDVESSIVKLAGNTFVSDDLTLSGNEPKAVISGVYKGYGEVEGSDSIDGASSSSAIIVNGKQSTLDLRKAGEVSLAGYSYISTKTYAGVDLQRKNIRMGESIAIKGGQLAYLMPPEWIGTRNGKSVFMHNPLSAAEYTSLKYSLDENKDNKYKLVNIDIVSERLGKKFSDYGVTTENLSEMFRTVVVRPIDGISKEGQIYFFVNLPSEMASEYYKDFYKTDMERGRQLNAYADFYTKAILTSGDANINTAGNYNIYTNKAEGLSYREGRKVMGKAEIRSYVDTFKALGLKLVTNLKKDIKPEDEKRDIFDNIIDLEKYNALLGGAGLKEVVGKDDKVAVVTNQNYTYDNTVTKDIKIIVSGGDVTLKRPYSGTIVAKGRIIMENAGNVTNDNDGIVKQLLREPVENIGHLHKIFRNGEALSGVSSEEAKTYITEDGSVDVSKLVEYSNWNKK